MDDIDRLLSIKLYDVMDQVGVSEKIRKLYQQTAIIEEIIDTISFQIRDLQFSFYIFGSSCEGTTTVGLNSDFDVAFCDDKFPVIEDIHAAPRGQSYLTVKDDHTYPGYVKLQLVRDGTPMTIYNTEIPDNHDTDTKGRICKTHVTHIEPGDNEQERHGPADAIPGNQHCIANDIVYVLRCRTIPMYARSWLNRRRRYHWPSRENLLKMGDLGCFFVGVGHSLSRERHMEWRLSFSLQERMLMFSLNPTQHKCYVLLKMIKKTIIMVEIGECISSYHCKTCLFHAIENTPAAIWRPSNLVCCVRLCLLILFTWSIKGVCPNYFIPLENMFERPQFRDNKYRLLDQLRALISDDRSFILRIQCDEISNRIIQPGRFHNNMTNIRVYSLYLALYGHIDMCYCILHGLANGNQSIHELVVALSQQIELLTNTHVIREHTEKQTRDAISYVIPVLHLYIAQRLASLVCKGQGQEYERQLLYFSIHHFQLANHADLMTSRLLVVSLLLRLEKYDLCEVILKDVEHDIKRYVVTNCICNARKYKYNADLLQYLGTHNVSCKTAIRTVYVCCVRFARRDTEIAPVPLQYEMYRSMGTPQGSRDERYYKWFDGASVDGKVYFYFLQYLVYLRLNRPANKQVAIDNLVWVIRDDPNLKHRETAYNLLGWIYVQEGRIPEALRCFVTSWEIRPDHNAAKFHILILARDLMPI